MRSNIRGPLLVAGVLLTSAILGGIYGPSVRATAAGANDMQDAARRFTRVVSLVQQNYAEPVDIDRAVFQGAIPGMLRVLDPHSSFFDARQFAVLREDQHGKYFGVGMIVAPRDGRTVVVAPFVGSPAYRAGLRPGDVILQVDGNSTEGLTNAEVADRLRGPKGTVVRITVGREGYAENLEFTVVRDEIPRHGVDYAMQVRPGIGYIRVTQFNEVTERELRDALDKLNPKTLDGLIIDLRGNPGGMLNAGVAVADMFLEKNQLIVSHRGRESTERRYHATGGNRVGDVAVVVLINGQSASASEIVAGALQDHDRGLVVGDSSFGKGLVQGVYTLSYNTGLALTTAKYYTPSGRLIQRDYKASSLYDYLYNRGKRQEQAPQVKLTDTGRQVFGGGGIQPDVIIPQTRYAPFQELLLRRDVFYPLELGVGGFTRHFLGTKPEVTKSFEVSDPVVDEFRKYLTRQNVPFTADDLQQHLDWVKRTIKREVTFSVFGMEEAYKLRLDEDVQLAKAIEVLPEARALYANAKKVLAQRTAGQVTLQ